MVDKSYYFFLIGFLDMGSVSVFIPYMSQYGRKLGSTPKWTGLAGSFYGLFQVFSSPIVGRLSDRYGRKPVMLVCYFATTLGYAALTITASYSGFILARMLSGSFKQGILLSKAYLSDITPSSSFTDVLGTFSSSVTAGAAIGVIIGGHLATYDTTFLTSAVVITLTFAFLTFFILLLPSQNIKNTSETPIFSNIPTLLTGYWDILLLKFVQQLAEMIYFTNLILFLEEQFTFSLSMAGYIMAFNSICAIFAASNTSFILNRLYNDNNILLATHFTIVCALGYVLILFLNTPVLFLALFMIESSSMIFRIVHLNLLFSRTSVDDRGVAIGILTSVGSVAKIIAPGLAGLLYEMNYTLPLFASSVILLSSIAVLFVVSLKANSIKIENGIDSN